MDSGYVPFLDQEERESSSESEEESHSGGYGGLKHSAPVHSGGYGGLKHSALGHSGGYGGLKHSALGHSGGYDGFKPAATDPFRPVVTPGGMGQGEESGGGVVFANFDDAFSETGSEHPNITREGKLIHLSFSENDQPAQDQQTQSTAKAQLKMEERDSASLATQFGNFDPWKVSETRQPKSSVDDLLGFGDSGDHSRVSLQSETKAVGAETFKPQNTASQASQIPHLDLFGAPTHSGSSDLFELLANPPLKPSASTPTLPVTTDNGSVKMGVSQQPNFNPHLLNPFKGPQQPAGVTRVTSQPQLHAFKPVFGTTTHATSPNYTSSGFGPHTAQQATGSGKNSPYGGSPYNSPRESPIPFGAHSWSTGNLRQSGGNGRADPFADIGNVKQMSGKPLSSSSGIPSTRASQQPMTSRPTYQYYGQPQHHKSQSTPTGSNSQPPRSQSPRPHSPRPNYTSVIGNREERGPRARTGNPPSFSIPHFLPQPLSSSPFLCLLYFSLLSPHLLTSFSPHLSQVIPPSIYFIFPSPPPFPSSFSHQVIPLSIYSLLFSSILLSPPLPSTPFKLSSSLGNIMQVFAPS